MNTEKARDGSGQSPPVTHELPTERWICVVTKNIWPLTLCLSSSALIFTLKCFCLSKMYVCINQINPTPAPLDAFLSAVLFPKGYINKSCKLPYAFVELGMNLSICMFPPGRIPRLLQGKYFPLLTRKRGFLFFYTVTASSKKSALLYFFPVFLSEHWCILCFSPFKISPGNQLSKWRAAAHAFVNRNVQ